MYSDKFERWFKMEMKFEGIYGNIPSDSGGETYHGLCRKYYPNLKVWKTLDKLPLKDKKKYIANTEELNEIKDIYFKQYWCKVRGDYYNDINLSYQVADFAVNAGVITSAKKLQTILGVKVDGIIGNITISAANAKQNALALFKQQRINYYNQVAKKGNNKIFLRGWLNRVENCKV